MTATSLRWILGVGIAVWGFWSLRATLESATRFDANIALHVILAVAAIATAALLIARDLARLVSRPLLLLIESLYMPDSHAEKPPLSFRLGRYYAANARLRDAEKEYLRMLRFYPRETDGWIELMTLYWTWQPKPRRRDARQVCQRGRGKVSDSAQKSALAHALATLKKGQIPIDFEALSARDKADGNAGG